MGELNSSIYVGPDEEQRFREMIREQVNLAMMNYKVEMGQNVLEVKEHIELRFDRLRTMIIGGFVVIGVMISIFKFIG